MVLAPYLAPAARAVAIPPLPPPMTRKSISLEMGAIASDEIEKCLDSDVTRLVAVAAAALDGAKREGLTSTAKERMGKQED